MATTPSVHQISVPTLLDVAAGNLASIGRKLVRHGIHRIVLVWGEGMEELFGDTVTAALRERDVEVRAAVTATSIEVQDVVGVAFGLPADAEAVVGIGGGKALDAAKYTAWLRSWPAVCVPTSTSNDGFASSNVSLTVDGTRISVQARMPFGILVDLDVIRSSPARFIYSGIGDLVAKITAAEDWAFEERTGHTVVDDTAMMIAKKAVNSFVRTDFGAITDTLFLKELLDSLSMCGIAMEIAGSSAPASGSEHLISHAIDEYGTSPQMHGIQVGVAAYLMSMVQHHRQARVKSVLTTTGFFAEAARAGLREDDFHMAIDRAPEVKPQRFTYLHVQQCRDEAHDLVRSDPILRDVLR